MPIEENSAGRLGNKLSRFHAIMRELERAVLLQELSDAGMNLCLAARRLGIHRNTLLRRCQVCDLDLGQLRKNQHTAEVVAEQRIARSA
jgi:DNA-binding NtrC family response regulator